MITIEQFAAFTSSVFAAITLWLVIKTKSLTDVIREMENQTIALIEQNKELASQTKILAGSYELQNQLTLTERIPYFKAGTFFRNKNNVEGEIRLINHGTMARNVLFFGPVSRDITFTGKHTGDKVVKNNEVSFYFTTPINSRDFKFDFRISFIGW